MKKRIITALFLCSLSACIPQPEPVRYRTPQELEKPLRHDRTVPQAPVSLEEAKQIALTNNPDLQSAFFAIQKAKYHYQASFAGYFPEINAEFTLAQTMQNTYGRKNPPSDVLKRESVFTTSPGISANLLLFDGFEREYRILIAKQDILAKEALQRDVKRVLMKAVIFAYQDILSAVENKRIAQANLEFQTSCLRQAESRFQNGFVPLDHVLNFKILRERAESELSTFDNEENLANYVLCALLGLNPMEFPGIIQQESCSACAERLDPLEEYLCMAAELRPDLEEARRHVQISEFQKYAVYSRFYPTVSAQANFNFSTNAGRTGGIPTSTYYYNAAGLTYGLYAKWNLFNGFYDYFDIREQDQAISERVSQLRQKWLAAAEEVAAAYSGYQNCLLQEKYYRNISQWARKQRDLVRGAYFAGNDTITRLNGAQSDLIAAQSQCVRAVIQRQKAFAGLQSAAGMIDTD